MHKINIPVETWISINDLERIVCEHDLYKKKYEKKFYDEILPIFDYSKRCDAKEIYFVNDRKQNNNFDGKIKLLNGNIISIECTNAINESRAEKRSQDLREDGRHSQNIPHLTTADSYAQQLSKIIEKAIQKKNSKKNKYEDFYLIVTISDPYFKYASPTDIDRILVRIKSSEFNQFQKVILYKAFNYGSPQFISEIDKKG